MTSYKITGDVSEGFERVQTQFEKNFIDGLETCAQLCVYVGEEKVIDLWGSVSDAKEYDGDTITNIFSSTKSLTAISFATLVEKNLLAYGDKIIKHWPEYGNGDKEKESITIADVLRHDAGMANFSETLKLIDIMRENIKKNPIGSIIEKESLRFPSPDKKVREYHAFTRGYILNEIFRRVDPEHRTIGECLRDEICKPLDADCYIGLEHEQLSKSYNLSFSSPGQILRSSFLPKAFGRKTVVNAIDLFNLMTAIPKNDNIPPIELYTDDIGGRLKFFDISSVKISEIPSANGQCSARGLAKVAAMMANEGTMDGKNILSKETCDKFHSGYEESKKMYPFDMQTNFSQGGVNYYFHDETVSNEFRKQCMQNRAGFVGWMGFGGSVLQWQRDHKIGFGYVPTFLAWEDTVNSKGALLQKLVLDCIYDMQKNEKM